MNVRTSLAPERKWRAIAVATVLLVPAFWVNVAGLALVPFAFVALAFLSEHATPPAAALRAMGLSVVVGAAAAVLTGDAVTGVVAGVGAGGIVALRRDEPHERRWRWAAVAVASVYTLVLAHVGGALVLLAAPAFPLTAIGVADHLAERRADREDPAVA